MGSTHLPSQPRHCRLRKTLVAKSCHRHLQSAALHQHAAGAAKLRTHRCQCVLTACNQERADGPGMPVEVTIRRTASGIALKPYWCISLCFEDAMLKLGSITPGSCIGRSTPEFGTLTQILLLCGHRSSCKWSPCTGGTTTRCLCCSPSW
jgi:hypothetical protein